VIDSASRSEKLGYELARLVISKDDPVFAYAQTPKARKFTAQGSYVAFLSSI